MGAWGNPNAGNEWYDWLAPLNPFAGLASGAAQFTRQSQATNPTPDLPAAVDTANAQNHPNQTNAFGATQTWGTGPDGRPTLTQGFSGPLAQGAMDAQKQYADVLSKPLDFSKLPALDYGQDAAAKARDAAYNQATSRLDPQWDKRQEALRTQLLNQGLDPSSAAFGGSMSDFGRDRNDAYASAHNYAVGQGQQAQQQAFGQSWQARQQALAEALGQRADPLVQLQGLQGLTRQPTFNDWQSQLPALLSQWGMGEARRKEVGDNAMEAFNNAMGVVLPFLPKPK